MYQIVNTYLNCVNQIVKNRVKINYIYSIESLINWNIIIILID